MRRKCQGPSLTCSNCYNGTANGEGISTYGSQFHPMIKVFVIVHTDVHYIGLALGGGGGGGGGGGRESQQLFLLQHTLLNLMCNCTLELGMKSFLHGSLL